METILLFLCYYVVIAMIVSLISGFVKDVGWAYAAALWPVIIIPFAIFCVIFIWWQLLRLFYKFGEMIGNLFK